MDINHYLTKFRILHKQVKDILGKRDLFISQKLMGLNALTANDLYAGFTVRERVGYSDKTPPAIYICRLINKNTLYGLCETEPQS
jgi:hypothetical protein